MLSADQYNAKINEIVNRGSFFCNFQPRCWLNIYLKTLPKFLQRHKSFRCRRFYESNRSLCCRGYLVALEEKKVFLLNQLFFFPLSLPLSLSIFLIHFCQKSSEAEKLFWQKREKKAFEKRIQLAVSNYFTMAAIVLLSALNWSLMGRNSINEIAEIKVKV